MYYRKLKILFRLTKNYQTCKHLKQALNTTLNPFTSCGKTAFGKSNQTTKLYRNCTFTSLASSVVMLPLP